MRYSSLLVLVLLAACTRGPKPPSDDAPERPEAPPRASERSAEAPAEAPAPAPAPSAGEGAGFDPRSPRVGGLAFRAPGPFAYRPASAPMRAAEYVVPGPSPAESAVLVVHHFPGMGGSVEANLARWLGQFTQPDGRDTREVARIERTTVNGLEVSRVDVTGTYTGMQPATGEPATALEGQRLVGAIVRGPEGPVFFKLVGPAPIVESALPAFEELVASLAPVP